MPRLRDGAGRNGEVWRGPCREFARGPPTQPAWGPSSTANSQRYISALGVGVRPVSSTVRGLYWGAGARTHKRRTAQQAVEWVAPQFAIGGRVLGFPRALPSSWGRFLVCYQSIVRTHKKQKNHFLLKRTGAERGRGPMAPATDTGHRRGGGKPSQRLGAPPTPHRPKRKNGGQQSLAALRRSGILPIESTTKKRGGAPVEKSVEKPVAFATRNL